MARAPQPVWGSAGERPGVPGGTRVEGFADAGRPDVVDAFVWGYEPPDYCPDGERARKHARTRTVGPDALASHVSLRGRECAGGTARH